MTQPFPMKPIHGEPVPLWQQRGLQPVPPVECGLKVGDTVTYTNEYGVKFAGLHIVGFGKTANGMEPTKNHPTPGLLGRFVYIDTSCYWFPKRPDELTLETV